MNQKSPRRWEEDKMTKIKDGHITLHKIRFAFFEYVVTCHTHA